MKYMADQRPAPGVGIDVPESNTGEYVRTSDRARSMGYVVTPVNIEGMPVFLVGRGCMSRVLPSVADVDEFLNRVDLTGGRHA